MSKIFYTPGPVEATLEGSGSGSSSGGSMLVVKDATLKVYSGLYKVNANNFAKLNTFISTDANGNKIVYSGTSEFLKPVLIEDNLIYYPATFGLLHGKLNNLGNDVGYIGCLVSNLILIFSDNTLATPQTAYADLVFFKMDGTSMNGYYADMSNPEVNPPFTLDLYTDKT